MSTKFHWTVSQSACCVYAADALRRGRSIVDEELARAVAEPAKLLHSEIAAAGLPADRLWRHLLPLSATVENNRQLVETALKKLHGASASIDLVAQRLGGRVADLEAAVHRALPELVKDMSNSAAPACEPMDAKAGPLLAAIGRLTDERLIVPDATVIVVPRTDPVGGTANLLYNSACIELVSDDSAAELPGLPELPEVLRLAWLVSQLNVDLPIFSENVHAGRRPMIAALSMLAVSLAAAEKAELSRCDLTTIKTALNAWQIEVRKANETAGVVLQWWETYLSSRPAWTVALRALDEMIGEDLLPPADRG